MTEGAKLYTLGMSFIVASIATSYGAGYCLYNYNTWYMTLSGVWLSALTIVLLIFGIGGVGAGLEEG
jgi:hypothetical protein